MKVYVLVVLCSVALMLPVANGSWAIPSIGAATEVTPVSAGQVVQTTNQQNQTVSGASVSTANAAGLNALASLIIVLTGPENWGTVTMAGPVGNGTEVSTPQRSAF